jgi:hypothetical protein
MGPSSRWDVWDNEFLDVVKDAHLTLEAEAGGEARSNASSTTGRGAPRAELSSEGHDENAPPAPADGSQSAPQAAFVAASFHPTGRQLRPRLRTRMTSQYPEW